MNKPGRPKRLTDRQTDNFVLDGPTKQALADLAEKFGVSRSEIVRRMAYQAGINPDLVSEPVPEPPAAEPEGER